MNGERDDDPDDDRQFGRPAWLSEFADDQDERDGRRYSPSRGGRFDDDLWDDEPTGWRRTVERVQTTPRAALALVAVGVVAAVIAAVAVFGSGSDGSAQYPVVNFSEPSSGAASSAATSAQPPSTGAASSSPAADAELVVAVVGLVRAPGLHRLAAQSRVADALAAAKGALANADTAGLNLAQPLRDGDQIVVGVIDQKTGVKLRSAVVAAGASASSGGAASGASGTSGASAAGTVNINTAGAEELDRLPGVGAATAAAILEYRTANGPFASVDDLAKVSGIGEAKLARIKPMATV